MIKAIIGLGNPGHKYLYTRHNIGFRILDTLAAKYGQSFNVRDEKEIAELPIHNEKVLLIKPLTGMNNSGCIIPFLMKKGIKPEEMLVVHDELELPFGKLGFKLGGSARGHNGLKSIISMCGDNFWRLRFGIGRPEDRSQVPDYVLSLFSEPIAEVEKNLDQAVALIEKNLMNT